MVTCCQTARCWPYAVLDVCTHTTGLLYYLLAVLPPGLWCLPRILISSAAPNPALGMTGSIAEPSAQLYAEAVCYSGSAFGCPSILPLVLASCFSTQLKGEPPDLWSWICSGLGLLLYIDLLSSCLYACLQAGTGRSPIGHYSHTGKQRSFKRTIVICFPVGVSGDLVG